MTCPWLDNEADGGWRQREHGQQGSRTRHIGGTGPLEEGRGTSPGGAQHLLLPRANLSGEYGWRLITGSSAPRRAYGVPYAGAGRSGTAQAPEQASRPSAVLREGSMAASPSRSDEIVLRPRALPERACLSLAVHVQERGHQQADVGLARYISGGDAVTRR
jgi:hypothetical protein